MMAGWHGRTHGVSPAGWPAAIAIAVAAAACLNSPDEEIPTEFEEIDADEVMYGVEHYMTNNGVREALMSTDTMYIWRDSTHTWAIGLALQVYDKRTGNDQATITADSGRLDMRANELQAIGNAVLDIPDQDRQIRTEELWVSPDSDRIWSDLPVVMRQSGCEIEGDRFDSDLSFKRVKLWGTRERDCPNR